MLRFRRFRGFKASCTVRGFGGSANSLLWKTLKYFSYGQHPLQHRLGVGFRVAPSTERERARERERERERESVYLHGQMLGQERDSIGSLVASFHAQGPLCKECWAESPVRPQSPYVRNSHIPGMPKSRATPDIPENSIVLSRGSPKRISALFSESPPYSQI